MQTEIKKNIGHNELNQKIQDKCDFLLVDVRSQDEHQSGTIANSICIPHEAIVENLDKLDKDKEIILFCRSGNRSSKACQVLNEQGYTKVTDLAGGITKWNEAGLPVTKLRKAIPLQRQVMIGAGSLVVLGAILGHFVNYGFWALSAFVGFGLVFAGITGFCGLALLLEKMPWNKLQ